VRLMIAVEREYRGKSGKNQPIPLECDPCYHFNRFSHIKSGLCVCLRRASLVMPMRYGEEVLAARGGMARAAEAAPRRSTTTGTRTWSGCSWRRRSGSRRMHATYSIKSRLSRHSAWHMRIFPGYRVLDCSTMRIACNIYFRSDCARWGRSSERWRLCRSCTSH
jgi:hypothetical protein